MGTSNVVRSSCQVHLEWRTYDDHIYAKQHQLSAEAVRHALQGVLGSAVGPNERSAVLSRYGGDVNYAAGWALQACVSTQLRQERLQRKCVACKSFISCWGREAIKQNNKCNAFESAKRAPE